MTALQHGIASVSTYGPLTDNVLRDADGTALQLSPVGDIDRFVQHTRSLTQSADRRHLIGDAGRRLYDDHFAFDATAKALANHLSEEVPA